MEKPQDLINLVPNSPAGAPATRGPSDANRKDDGGADFAEAMRAATGPARAVDRDSRNIDAREARSLAARETRAPDAAEQAAGSSDPQPTENAPQAPAARATAGRDRTSREDAPSDDAGASSSSADNSLAGSGLQIPGASGATVAAAAFAAAPLQAPAVQPAPVAAPVASAPVASAPVASASSLAAPVPQSGIAAPANLPGDGLNTLQNNSLQTAGQSPSTPAAPTLPGIATATAAAALGPAVLPGQNATDAQVAGLAAADAATRTEQPAIAPAPVAMAVDRAIGNAIVSLPATGPFRAAEVAKPTTADPARIASTGFVAAALSALPTNGSTTLANTDGGSTDAGSGMMSGQQSPWLAVQADALSMRLADGAILRDALMQVRPQLEQMLQSLDQKLASVSAAVAGAQSAIADAVAAGAANLSAATTGSPLSAQAVQLLANAPAAPLPEAVRLTVNAPLEQASRWATEFGDRLAWVANNRFSAATLQVNPPQLGPIEVRIMMTGDQAAVSFAAVQPQTREAIQQALPMLASSFAGQGLTLGQTSVGNQNLPQQSNSGNPGSGGGQPSLMLGGRGDAGLDAITATGGGQTRGGQGLVDTFA